MEGPDSKKPAEKPRSSVLLLGHPRSGTNYLKSLISIHPEVSSLNEPYSLHSRFFAERSGKVWTENDYDQDHVLAELSDHASLKDLAKTLQLFLEPSDKGVNLVKETSFLLKLKWLREYLKQVKVVYLLRSPYGVASSFKKDGLYKKWGYEKEFRDVASQIHASLKDYEGLLKLVNDKSETSKLAFLWTVKNLETLRNLEKFEHVIVKYEHLLEDTEAELKQVCGLMEIDFQEIQEKFIRESQRETLGTNIYSSFRDKTLQQSETGRYLTEIELGEIERLLEEARNQADKMNLDFGDYLSYKKPTLKEGESLEPRSEEDTRRTFSSEGCFSTKADILKEVLRDPLDLEGVFFSRFPITNAQFSSFLNAEKVKNKEDLTYKYVNTYGERCRIRQRGFRYEVEEGYKDHPCVYVNWHGCKAFCEWLGVTLPTLDTVQSLLDKISSENMDLDEINIAERVGEIVPVFDMTYREELLNLIGNTWKWTDANEEDKTASEYGGAFNSSKHEWDVVSNRHKRFGASNLGFQIIIPHEKLESLMIPTAEIGNLTDLEETLSNPEFSQVQMVFFDLDGTLHDFRKTARIAMNAVYDRIEVAHALNREEMIKEYGNIIAQAEKTAFVEGKTSLEYRGDRFSALLKHFSMEDPRLVSELVGIYGEVLEDATELEDSVLAALKNLSEKYKLYLITEGPLDAQLRAVERLGIGNFFEKIFTSGEHGEIKETGDLFTFALKDLGLKKEAVVIVGDSPARDIRGANLVGVSSILVTMFTKPRNP